MGSQETYKRNQLEGALHALLSGPSSSAGQRLGQAVPHVFSTRIKRLLEIDRRQGLVNKDHLDKAPMAFFDALPQGTGTDAVYSAERIFNVAIALELLRFGCKQSEVVEKVALMQPELKRAFERATATVETKGPHRFVDGTKVLLPKVRRNARRVEPKLDPTIFLVIRYVEASKRMAEWSDRGGRDPHRP